VRSMDVVTCYPTIPAFKHDDADKGM